MKTILKPYKNTDDCSYTSGAYATIELVQAKPEQARAVYIHPDYAEPERILSLCAQRRIPAARDENAFRRLGQKENCYVLGVFKKYECRLARDRPHIVLVNPADMGNLGTIIRTMAGLGYGDLAVVTPAADIWHPKTVRASMGALFRVRFCPFVTFDAYRAAYPNHALFPFMPGGALELRSGNRPKAELYALIFGNEASGLGPDFFTIGTSVSIPQPGPVDSFNLAVAAAIGMYAFSM